jgi:hypothetical protein
MLELGPYGSVRGARGNSRPYREPGSIRDRIEPAGNPATSVTRIADSSRTSSEVRKAPP